jgi:hypothetical protein
MDPPVGFFLFWSNDILSDINEFLSHSLSASRPFYGQAFLVWPLEYDIADYFHIYTLLGICSLNLYVSLCPFAFSNPTHPAETKIDWLMSNLIQMIVEFVRDASRRSRDPF